MVNPKLNKMDIPHSISFDDITYSPTREGQEPGLRRHTRNGLREIIVLTVIRTSHIIAIRDAALEEPKPFIKSVIIKSYPFWEDRVGLVAFFELLADARGLETLEFDCQMDKFVASQIALYLEQGKLKDLHHLILGPRLKPSDVIKEFCREVASFKQINHVTLTPNTDESSVNHYKDMFSKRKNITHAALNITYSYDSFINGIAKEMTHVKHLEVENSDFVSLDGNMNERPSSSLGFLYKYPETIKYWKKLETFTWRIDAWQRQPSCRGLAPIFENLSQLPRLRSFSFILSSSSPVLWLAETCVDALKNWIERSKTIQSFYLSGVSSSSAPLVLDLIETASKSHSMRKITLPVEGVHGNEIEAYEYVKKSQREDFQIIFIERHGQRITDESLVKLAYDAKRYQIESRAELLLPKIRKEDSRVYQSTGLPEDVVRNTIMGEFLGIKL